MKKNLRALLLILPLVMTLAAFNLPSIAATTRTFNIYQNNNIGGAGCSGQAQCFNSTSPGPNIVVNQGDMVSITVHNNDSITHTFTFAPLSPYNIDKTLTGAQVVTIPTFTASTSGTWTYKCTIHPNNMFGTFKVNATSTAPINLLTLISLLMTTMAAVYIVERRRR